MSFSLYDDDYGAMSVPGLSQASVNQGPLTDKTYSPTFLHQNALLNNLYYSIDNCFKNINNLFGPIKLLMGIHDFSTPQATYFPLMKTKNKITLEEFNILNKIANSFASTISDEYKKKFTIKKLTVYYCPEQTAVVFCQNCQNGVCNELRNCYHEYFTKTCPADYILKDRSLESMGDFCQWILKQVVDAYQPQEKSSHDLPPI